MSVKWDVLVERSVRSSGHAGTLQEESISATTSQYYKEN